MTIDEAVRLPADDQRAVMYRPRLTAHPMPVFQHARAEPFLDQPHDAPVSDAALGELDQPSVLESDEWKPICREALKPA